MINTDMDVFDKNCIYYPDQNKKELKWEIIDKCFGVTLKNMGK